MEVLIGAACPRAAADVGLTGAEEPRMGRVACRYRVWRIGVAGVWAQRWVDRTVATAPFALDYTFKSVEKVLDGPLRHAVRQAQVVSKDAAYDVRGPLIDAVETYDLAGPVGEDGLAESIRRRLDERIDVFRERMAPAAAAVGAVLQSEHAERLLAEYQWWDQTDGWRLINVSDSCGT